MRFRLDSWQSDYAFPYDPAALDPADAPDAEAAVVDVTVEAPAHDWAPIAPHPSTPPHDWAPIAPHPSTPPFEVVRFVDGVQSSDAVIWITDGRTQRPFPGLVASWGAGVITSRPHGAELERMVIERGVFSDARSLGPIIAGNLTWRPQAPEAPLDGGLEASPSAQDPMALRERLGVARRRLESRVGRIESPDGEDALVVYDGLLHDGSRPLTAIGLAKRAHRVYLPESLQPIQRALARGERTPLFSPGGAPPPPDPPRTTATASPGRRGRLSFYLALADPLPPAVAEPGSCVARIELAIGSDTTIGQAAAFADRVAATLPRYASEPHVDPRAPQNLMPIRSLESELRRLLGRPSVIRPLLATEAALSHQ